VVAGAADQVVEPCAFAAEDENAVAGEVEAVVVGQSPLGRTGIQTDDPDILTLEFFEGSDEIDDASNAEVFGRAGAGFDGDRAEGGGAALGEDDAVDARAIGYAEKCAEILRVFDTVEGEEEASDAGFCCRAGLEEVFDGERLLRMDKGDYTLVGGGLGNEGKLLAGFLTDTDARLTAPSHQLFEAGVVALLSYEDMVEAAASSLEGFLHRMQTVQNFHDGSVEDRG
jgi:hypothetical protein